MERKIHRQDTEKIAREILEKLPWEKIAGLSGEDLDGVGWEDLTKIYTLFGEAIERKTEVLATPEGLEKRPFKEFIDERHIQFPIEVRHCGAPGAMLNPEPIFHSEEGRDSETITVAHGIQGECTYCHVKATIPVNGDPDILLAIAEYKQQNQGEYIGVVPQEPEYKEKTFKEGQEKVSLREGARLPKVKNQDDDEVHNGGEAGVIIADELTFRYSQTKAKLIYANAVVMAAYGVVKADRILAAGGLWGESLGNLKNQIGAKDIIIGASDGQKIDDKEGIFHEVGQIINMIKAERLVMLPGAKLVVHTIDCDELVMMEGSQIIIIHSDGSSRIGKKTSDGTSHSFQGGVHGVPNVQQEVVIKKSELIGVVEQIMEEAGVGKYRVQLED